MRPYRQPIFSLALFVLLLTACKKDQTTSSNTTSPPPPSTTQQDIAAVDTKVQTFLTQYHIPGASLAVSKNGKLVYRKGYGVADQTSNTAVNVNSRFRLASVSKTYTAVAIMKLVQEGKLGLEDKVFGSGAVLGTDYGTQPYSAHITDITVHELLNHTSGVWGAATGGDVIDQNPAYSNKQFLDWVLNTRPVMATPGTKFDYSNVNYFILSRIIEKVSGKPYLTYIKDMLATIGDSNTDIAGSTESERKSNEVNYYGQGNDAQYVYNILFSRRDGDAGLLTTATDLLRFVNAIDGFNTRPDLLNAASLSALTTPPAVNNSYACGIGIWSSEHVWFNYGSLPGTRTGFMRRDNGMNAVLLLNSRVDPTTGDNPFIYALQDVLLDLVKNTSYNWQDIDQFN